MREDAEARRSTVRVYFSIQSVGMVNRDNFPQVNKVDLHQETKDFILVGRELRGNRVHAIAK